MTNLLHKNDMFVTVLNKCSKIPPSTSMHFATRVLKSRVVHLNCSSPFLMRAAASKMLESSSSRVVTFFFPVNLAHHSTPQTKRGKNSVRQIHAALPP